MRCVNPEAYQQRFINFLKRKIKSKKENDNFLINNNNNII